MPQASDQQSVEDLVAAAAQKERERRAAERQKADDAVKANEQQQEAVQRTLNDLDTLRDAKSEELTQLQTEKQLLTQDAPTSTQMPRFNEEQQSPTTGEDADLEARTQRFVEARDRGSDLRVAMATFGLTAGDVRRTLDLSDDIPLDQAHLSVGTARKIGDHDEQLNGLEQRVGTIEQHLELGSDQGDVRRVNDQQHPLHGMKEQPEAQESSVWPKAKAGLKWILDHRDGGPKSPRQRKPQPK